MSPTCEEPGCGMKMTEYVPPSPIYKDEGYYRCPRNDDAHELCSRVAELEDALQIADLGLFAPVSRDLRFKDDARLSDWNMAMDAAVSRRANQKEAPHDETL